MLTVFKINEYTLATGLLFSCGDGWVNSEAGRLFKILCSSFVHHLLFTSAFPQISQ